MQTVRPVCSVIVICMYSYVMLCWITQACLQCFGTVGSASGKASVTVKNWVMRCWHGYLPGTTCKWFACAPADAATIPLSLASVKSIMVYLYDSGLPRLSLKRAAKWECVCLLNLVGSGAVQGIKRQTAGASTRLHLQESSSWVEQVGIPGLSTVV